MPSHSYNVVVWRDGLCFAIYVISDWVDHSVDYKHYTVIASWSSQIPTSQVLHFDSALQLCIPQLAFCTSSIMRKLKIGITKANMPNHIYLYILNMLDPDYDYYINTKYVLFEL